MERMLHYIWKHKLYAESGLMTTEGVPVSVIDAGIPNADAGPDFFNAKVRIGETIWAGNVEIHERASDWVAHNHNNDRAYDNIILHVVRYDNAQVYNTKNKVVPQLVMAVPENVENNIKWLLSRDTPVPCKEHIYRIPPIDMSGWLAALVTERLERKTSDISVRLEQYSKDWNEVFYITLMRNFGFSTNGDAFELLAKSLPYKYILKHRHNPLQVEALFLGQAGFLDDDGADPYLKSLRGEYDFLKKKYGLQPVEEFLFKSMRTRPINFPHLRLAQIAAVFMNKDLLFSEILEKESVDDLRSLFNVLPSEYWETHYNFRSSSAAKKKPIGRGASDLILINTAIPVLFAYGKYKGLSEYCERALRFLEEIPPEHNSIITMFCSAGISVKSAGDTQALIQLRREYCDKKKCLYCRIGFRVIGN